MPARVFYPMLGRFRSTLRGRNALLHTFELWVGLAGIVSGVVFFWQPGSLDGNAVEQTIGHSLTEAWVLAYAAAGFLIWYGLLRPAPRYEAAGLWLLGAATFAEGFSIIGIFGWRGAPTAAVLIALTAAAWLRGVIVQADVLRLAREYEDDQPAAGGEDGGG